MVVPRPRVTFDGTILKASEVKPSIVASTTALTNDYYTLSTTNVDSVTLGQTLIANSYQQYKFLNCAMEWIPAVGPADPEARARIYVATMESPEIMQNIQQGTPTLVQGFILRSAKPMIFNAWERVTYNIPMKYRRKEFSCNAQYDTTAGVTDRIDELDRVTQQIVAVVYDSAASAKRLGSWRFTYTLQLRTLAFTQLST